MPFQNPSRRAALYALPALAAAPMVSSAAVASVTADPAPALDPVFAARAAWKEAERRFLDAENRAETAGGDKFVTIPAVIGEPYRAGTDAEIDRIIKQERTARLFNSAEWNPVRMTETEIADMREKQEAARRYVGADADALKADLAERKARHAAAMEAESVEALDQADRDALRAYLDTPAATAAGIALKLRDAEYREGDEVSAAIADLDRLAGSPSAASGSPQSAGAGQGKPSRVEVLHGRYLDALRAVDDATDETEITRLVEIANQIEADMIAAPLTSPRDVALIVLVTGGDYLAGMGIAVDQMVARLEAIAGQGVA